MFPAFPKNAIERNYSLFQAKWENKTTNHARLKEFMVF